jgi:hypothetical protein
MGALPILTRDDRNGMVFVQDQNPDGTIVVLRCAAGNDVGGVAITPQKPKVWPMFLDMETEGLRMEDVLPSDFELVLDTTELPVGRLEFDLGQFVEQIEQSLKTGGKVIHLNRKDASQWGLRIKEAAH